MDEIIPEEEKRLSFLSFLLGQRIDEDNINDLSSGLISFVLQHQYKDYVLGKILNMEYLESLKNPDEWGAQKIKDWQDS